MKLLLLIATTATLSACSQGLISDEKKDAALAKLCAKQGLEQGTPAFQSCMLAEKQKEYKKMREAEKKVEYRMRQQKRLIEDYRNRL